MNRIALILVCLLSASGPALAKNVDLVTLPRRDTVQLTIYNSEDLTLVKETRYVTFKKGHNRLQFSWAGTLIDPTSVQIRPLQHADEVELMDTVFPGQKPRHLIWNIESEIEGQIPVEVQYFTSGLTWSMDYVALCNPTETSLSVRGNVHVFNRSGEEYENAQIRLVVGKINLIEKIAQLANRQGVPVPTTGTATHDSYRRKAVLDLVDAASVPGLISATGGRPKQIIKEGVSEYFLFTVDGHETIRNGWSKRMLAVKADDVEFKITYRMRAYQYGPRPVRFFSWRNDQQHKLGESPLPNGLIRVFRENGQEGLSYLGQQNLNYVPVQAEIEVNLGTDDLVVYTRRRSKTTRSDFQFSVHRQVTGWNESQSWVDTVRNYRAKPITVQLRLQWPGDVEFQSEKAVSLFDFRTVETTVVVEPRQHRELVYDALIHHGTNAKQNRVRLK